MWGEHIVRGYVFVPGLRSRWLMLRRVNLGGWLVTERECFYHRPRCMLIRLAFIAPALYEEYQNTSIRAIDEYTLSQA